MRNTDEFWRNREQSFHRQPLSRIFVCYAPARTTSHGATQKKARRGVRPGFWRSSDNAYFVDESRYIVNDF
jgi:hypothetical protein